MGTIRGHRYGVYMANRTRILSWNVNGIRAALRKGFGQFIEDLSPDIVMLQEVRALPEQIPAPWVQPEGWNVHWHPAEEEGVLGYSNLVSCTVGNDGYRNGFRDPEGRLLHTKSNGVHTINLYLPSGSSSPERQEKKRSGCADFYRGRRGSFSHQSPSYWLATSILRIPKMIFITRAGIRRVQDFYLMNVNGLPIFLT